MGISKVLNTVKEDEEFDQILWFTERASSSLVFIDHRQQAWAEFCWNTEYELRNIGLI
jgi:hypothetical protein